MVVNDHSPTRITIRSHEIPNYGPEQLKFEIDDYRKKCFPEKLADIKGNSEKQVKN